MDTKIREANVSEVPTPPAQNQAKPAEMLYCVRHEKMYKAELSVDGLGHVVAEAGEGGDDLTLDFCTFPLDYAFSPPPETSETPELIEPSLFDEDWAAQDDTHDEAAELAAFVNSWEAS